VGAENLNPLDELKSLGEQIELATDLAALKPIYYRLNEIAQSNLADFDVQLAASDIKQRLVARGTQLKQQESSPVPPSMMTPAPPPPPPISFIDAPAPVPPEPPLVEFAITPEAARPVVNPPQPLASPPPPPRSTPIWKRAWVLGALAALVLTIVLIALLVNPTRKRNLDDPRPSTAAVPVTIATSPSGASVRVASAYAAPAGNSETTCTSDCRLTLAPGNYQVTAFLNGFEPSAGNVNVIPGQPAVLSLALQPQAQTVRLLTDLPQGKVILDDHPPADLQEGQFVFDKVQTGSHTVKIMGGNADASFSFEIADARLPVVTGPVKTHNLIAVLVSSLGKQARVVSSAGPLKLALNGQPQGEAGPSGADLTNFQPGVNEIVLGEGRDRRNMNDNFGVAPALTVFLKSDVETGTLIVATDQDDVRVFLNNKEHPRHTQRGQLRIQASGRVAVRVAKGGFQDEPPQTAEVKKGAEVRLAFNLKPQPQFASLQIRGGTAGAEVLLDQKNVGAVGQDGSFSFNLVSPGDHTIALQHEQYMPKRLQRAFRAGQAVMLTGADVVLAASNGTIRLARNPAAANITYRRADETESHEANESQLDLPPGTYVFSASAPGYTDSTTRVQLAAGESRPIEITLVRERVAAPTPAPATPVAGGIADFEDPQAWRKEGELWVHKGGGFVPYKLPAKGVFTFTVELLKGGNVFRGGRIRWCVQYLDARNYLLFEMDRKNFWAEVVDKGKKSERQKTQHDLEKQKAVTIQIEVTADRLVQKALVGGDWTVLDTFSEAGRDFTQGKFGFLIQGNDEIGISDFKFTPR
jgi:hypothetical protein